VAGLKLKVMLLMKNGCDTWGDWEQLNSDQKDFATYQLLTNIDRRLQNLENRKWMNSVSAFVGGALGGAATVAGYLFIISRALGA